MTCEFKFLYEDDSEVLQGVTAVLILKRFVTLMDTFMYQQCVSRYLLSEANAMNVTLRGFISPLLCPTGCQD
jgi:hypothetical protein